MNQSEFFERLEEQVRTLDAQVQEINGQIGQIKGLILDYEFAHRNEISGKKNE